MVMADDSCLRGHGFKSQRHILDGHFFTLICCKNCIACLKRPKINKKEAGVGPFQITFLRELPQISGLVRTYHPLVLGFNPKHTVSDFSIYGQILYNICHCVEKRKKIN